MNNKKPEVALEAEGWGNNMIEAYTGKHAGHRAVRIRLKVDISDAGRSEIDGLRSSDDASAWAQGIEFEELLASTSSVAVGRKGLYHDHWAGLAENFTSLIRSFLPDEVEVYSRAGHVYAWRPDLLRLTLEEIERSKAGSSPSLASTSTGRDQGATRAT